MERKRARSMSMSSSSSSGRSMRSASRSLSPQPAAKYHRAPTPERTYICNLPPSCSQPDTSQAFATAAELEAHQVSRHRWVCRIPIRDKPGRVGEGQLVVTMTMPEQFVGRAARGRSGERWRECGKVFPDERLLDLHYTETHDPIAKERQERGEKIFECFLPMDQCSKTFQNPKKRRQHLIEKHHYPSTYFFAITNHGLNLITRTDGPAASLIRPPRQTQSDSGATNTAGTSNPPTQRRGKPPRQQWVPIPDEMDIDELTTKMESMDSSLAFVPRNVRRGPPRVAKTRTSGL